MSEAVLVLSTVGTRADAERIARALVDERLAACVNLVPGILSTYRWKGEVSRDEELLLVVKTTAARVDDLRQRILALHPYELPEVVVVPVAGGHAAYLAWIGENVR